VQQIMDGRPLTADLLKAHHGSALDAPPFSD
jgi:hypothetical protein